jgi:dephospho-CoA kinase
MTKKPVTEASRRGLDERYTAAAAELGGEICNIGAALNSALSRAILYHDPERRRQAARLAHQLGDLLARLTP